MRPVLNGLELVRQRTGQMRGADCTGFQVCRALGLFPMPYVSINGLVSFKCAFNVP